MWLPLKVQAALGGGNFRRTPTVDMPTIGSRVLGRFLASLILSFAVHSTTIALELSDFTVSYRGSVVFPTARLAGEPVAATFEWRELDLAQTESVFNQTPADLALSYTSFSFSAQQTSALGNYVRLAVGPRVADHAEVVLVTWATAAKYPDWAARDPSGYTHPITVMLYRLDSSGGGNSLQFIEQATVHAHIPWRPVTLPDGRPYPVNGYAFRVLVPLSAAITVPDDCLIAVAYNTQSHGFKPIGSPGPYNELNVALTRAAPLAGWDNDPDAVLWVRNGVWNYPASNWSSSGSPMLHLASRNQSPAAPILSNDGGPVDAGLYHVRATHPEVVDAANAVLEITKASARILAVGTKRSVADEDRGVVLETDPQGLELAVSYQGAQHPPAKPGSHPFRASVIDRNHEGTLDGELLLTAVRYSQWRKQNPQASESGIADTDGDGIPDWVEYAVGNDPSSADYSIMIHQVESGFQWRFQQRRWMDEIILKAELSQDLTAWVEAVPQVVEQDAEWETLVLPHQETNGFIRLKAERVGDR